MKAVLYERVSSEEQAKEGYSIRAQRERLESFAKSQGWTIHKSYTDDGYSAKDLKRPAMEQLMKDVKKGYFDVILVYKLDRLVRSVVDLHELLTLFDDNKVKFKSATEMFDTTTATGRMFITLVAILAQWELEQLRERTIFGMERKFKEGQRNGGKAPFGYALDDDSQLILADEAKIVKWMFENAMTMGKKSIAKRLNHNGVKSKTGTLWNANMVDYVLNNPVYCGKLRWNYRKKKGARTYEEIIIPGKHEPIISEEQFNEVQSARKDRQNKGFKGHAFYPFTSIAKCNKCGHNYIGGKRKRADGSEYRFYKCNGRFVYGVCDASIIGEDVLEEEFLKQLDFLEVDPEIPAEETADREEIQKQLNRIKNRLERLKELFIDGDLSKKEYRERVNEEKEKESELIQTLEASEEILTQQDLEKLVSSVKNQWSRFNSQKKKEIVQNLFESLTIDVLQSHKGGRGQRAVIDIVDYSLK